MQPFDHLETSKCLLINYYYHNAKPSKPKKEFPILFSPVPHCFYRRPKTSCPFPHVHTNCLRNQTNTFKLSNPKVESYQRKAESVISRAKGRSLWDRTRPWNAKKVNKSRGASSSSSWLLLIMGSFIGDWCINWQRFWVSNSVHVVWFGAWVWWHS
jgi:hypothetical protein